MRVLHSELATSYLTADLIFFMHMNRQAGQRKLFFSLNRSSAVILSWNLSHLEGYQETCERFNSHSQHDSQSRSDIPRSHSDIIITAPRYDNHGDCQFAEHSKHPWKSQAHGAHLWQSHCQITHTHPHSHTHIHTQACIHIKEKKKEKKNSGGGWVIKMQLLIWKTKQKNMWVLSYDHTKKQFIKMMLKTKSATCCQCLRMAAKLMELA